MKIETFQPPYAGPSVAEIDAAHAVLEDQRKALEDVAARTLITCTTDSQGTGCGHRQAVCDSTFRQTHWYVRPYGCSGGDYWRTGEGQFVCNVCSKITRLYDSEDVTKMLLAHAKTKEDVYGR